MPKRDGVKRIIETHEVLKTSPLSKVMQWIKGQVDKVKSQRFVCNLYCCVADYHLFSVAIMFIVDNWVA